MNGHPLADQLDMFREMAAEARKDAAGTAPGEMKDAYEHLASSWDQLIDEITAATASEKERPKQRADESSPRNPG